MTAGINELKTSMKRMSYECKCKFDDRKCNSNKKWNNNKCWSECKSKEKTLYAQKRLYLESCCVQL